MCRIKKINSLIAGFLACIICFSTFSVALGGLTASADSGETYMVKYSSDGDCYYFQTETSSITNGIIISPLGYFVSFYDSSDGSYIGKIFVTDTTQGRACYDYVNNRYSIPRSLIENKTKVELSQQQRDQITSAQSKGTLRVVFDTLISIAALTNSVLKPGMTLTSADVTANQVWASLAAYDQIGTVDTGRNFAVHLGIFRFTDADGRVSGLLGKKCNLQPLLYVSSAVHQNADRKQACLGNPNYTISFSQSLYNSFSYLRADRQGETVNSLIMALFSDSSKVNIPAGYFAVPSPVDPQIISGTDLYCYDIYFTESDNANDGYNMKYLEEGKSYRPVYVFYNNGPACTANLNCKNDAADINDSIFNVSIDANSYYKVLGARFYVDSRLGTNSPNDNYDYSVSNLYFHESCEVTNMTDLDTSNNSKFVTKKFSVNSPASVINAKTYEEYDVNGSENLFDGFVDSTETDGNNSVAVVKDNIVTLTANSNDGYIYFWYVARHSRVRLEAGKEYIFKCETDGKWRITSDEMNDSAFDGSGKTIGTTGKTPDTVQVYLFKDGDSSTYISTGDPLGVTMTPVAKNTFVFTCQSTGDYYFRFDVDLAGKTYYFKNIGVFEKKDTTTDIADKLKEKIYSEFGGVTAYGATGSIDSNDRITLSTGSASYNESYAKNLVNLVKGQTYVLKCNTNGEWRSSVNRYGNGENFQDGDAVLTFLEYDKDGVARTEFDGLSHITYSSDKIINMGESQTTFSPYTFGPSVIPMKQIGEETFAFTCLETGTYALRLILVNPNTTFWFDGIEIYKAEKSVFDSLFPEFEGNDDKIENRICELLPNANTQNRLDAKDGGTVNGTPVQTYITNGTVAQQWVFEKADNSSYYIKNVKSGLVLDCQNGATTDGTPIWLYEKNGTDAQKWTVKRDIAGNYQIINVKSGKALDVPNANSDSGTPVELYTKNDTLAQRWKIKFLDEPAVDYDDSSASATLKSGVLKVTAKSDTGTVIPGYTISGYRVTLEAGKQYTLYCDTDGEWADVDRTTGNVEMCLVHSDVAHDNRASATDTEVISSSNSGQLWGKNWIVMDKIGTNTFTFTAKKSGTYFLALDVYGKGETKSFYNLRVTEKGSSTGKNMNVSEIKVNTSLGKVYSGQPVRYYAEYINASSFNILSESTLKITGVDPTTVYGSLLSNSYSSSGYISSLSGWELSLGADTRAKFTNKESYGSVLLSTTKNERTIMGKYPDSDSKFKTTYSKNYKIYPSDLEAVSVKVFDADTGKQITKAKDGQKVRVEYTYKNNTEIPVYATVMYTGNNNKTFDSPTVDIETGVSEIGADQYTPLLGDVNGDGKVTNIDRTILSRYLAKWPDYETLPNAEVADINMDGIIDEEDEKIIANYLSGSDKYIEEYNTLKNRFDSYCWHLQDIVLDSGESYKITKEYVISSKDYSTFKPEGRIYIEGLDFDASYEYNEDNNIATTTVTVESPFSGKIVNINSNYRKSKTVITSVEVSNSSLYEMGNNFYTTFYGTVSAEMKIYDNKNCTGNPIITVYSDTDICVPEDNKDTTLIWFKWTVPTKCPDKLYAKIVLDCNNNYSSSEYIDNGSNSKNFGATFNIETPKVYNTPDTTFAKESPYWFDDAVKKKLSSPASNISFYGGTKKIENTLSWEYYVPADTGIEKIKETATLKGSTVKIIPDGTASAYVNGNFKWTMKSGYGFKIDTEFKDNGQYCTGVQSGFAIFPEFTNMMATNTTKDSKGRGVNFYTNTNSLRSGFEGITGKTPTSGGNYATFATLETNSADSFKLPNNESSKSATHFVPIWYPDGDYHIVGYFADAWTPGGMLSSKISSSSIVIDGNMYDDYVVSEK